MRPSTAFAAIAMPAPSVASYIDPQTHLPVYSLYGASRHPSAEMLEGVDVLAFDIQDVGSRAYTYISTMAYAMQGAKEFGKEFWVFDRPNPIGGAIEGPVLEPAYESFIGLYPIPMRHGMTVGELAMLFNDHFGIGAKLRVVKMTGWQPLDDLARYRTAMGTDLAEHSGLADDVRLRRHRPARQRRHQQRQRLYEAVLARGRAGPRRERVGRALERARPARRLVQAGGVVAASRLLEETAS